MVFLNYSLYFLTHYWVLHVFSDQRAGLSPWDAVISAPVRRFRPIMLTALTGILALIPLTQSTFLTY